MTTKIESDEEFASKVLGAPSEEQLEELIRKGFTLEEQGDVREGLRKQLKMLYSWTRPEIAAKMEEEDKEQEMKAELKDEKKKGHEETKDADDETRSTRSRSSSLDRDIAAIRDRMEAAIKHQAEEGDSSFSDDSGGSGSDSSEDEQDDDFGLLCDPSAPDTYLAIRKETEALLNKPVDKFWPGLVDLVGNEMEDICVKGSKWISRIHVDWNDFCIVLASVECSTKRMAQDSVIKVLRNLFHILLRKQNASLLDFGRGTTALSHWMISRRPDAATLFHLDREAALHAKPGRHESKEPAEAAAAAEETVEETDNACDE